MSQGSYGSDADRHRQQAEATEVHAKHPAKHAHSGSGAGKPADAEATWFIRHRTPLAAVVLTVIAIIFFTVTVIAPIRF
jgi:hypothetical protein